MAKLQLAVQTSLFSAVSWARHSLSLSAYHSTTYREARNMDDLASSLTLAKNTLDSVDKQGAFSPLNLQVRYKAGVQ